MGQERGVIYARTSGVQQKEKQAIHAQLSLGKAILALRGIMLVGTYIDDGISGETIEQRLQMLRLLDDAEQGKFHYLFVADIDRLTRSQKSVDWEIIKESLRRGKVFLLTPSQEYDFGNEDQEFVSDLFAKIAAYEKKKIVRRSGPKSEKPPNIGSFSRPKMQNDSSCLVDYYGVNTAGRISWGKPSTESGTTPAGNGDGAEKKAAP